MIAVMIHYQARGAEQQQLPVLPAVGSYLAHAGRLWTVAAVLFSGDTTHVYAAAVGEGLAGELESTWATWSEAAPAEAAAPEQQRELFEPTKP
jgi:hypothetical protein